MNELDPTNQTPKDNIREERQAQQLWGKKPMGELFVPRGHTVYSVNLTTGEIKEAEYEHTNEYDPTRMNSGDGYIAEGVIIKGKVKHDPNLILFTALNMKNAKRKIANEFKNLND